MVKVDTLKTIMVNKMGTLKTTTMIPMTTMMGAMMTIDRP